MPPALGIYARIFFLQAAQRKVSDLPVFYVVLRS
jgi:hypothetical protein